MPDLGHVTGPGIDNLQMATRTTVLKSSASHPKQRVPMTRERWAEAATEVLVDFGIDHVRVDALASHLEVTRGSFYYHFRDREELLRAVLQAWQEKTTKGITERLAAASDDPAERLRDVLRLPFHGRTAVRAAKIELAIRAWARRDQLARQAVDEADASRMRHIQSQFLQLGFGAGEANARAVLLYGHLLAQSLLSSLQTEAEKEERWAAVERLLLRSV